MDYEGVERRYAIVSWRSAGRGKGLLTAEQVAEQAQVHPEMVLRLAAIGVIEAAEAGGEDCFAPSCAYHVRRAIRLHDDLGLNWRAVGLVLDLLDRLERLERQLP